MVAPLYVSEVRVLVDRPAPPQKWPPVRLCPRGAALPSLLPAAQAGKPLGSTLPDSPRPATPSAERRGGQLTALSPVSA
jgi:hypothetical protein